MQWVVVVAWGLFTWCLFFTIMIFIRISYRWASFGTGLLAYHAMSNLARSGHYHSGYYHRNDYYNSHYSKYSKLSLQ